MIVNFISFFFQACVTVFIWLLAHLIAVIILAVLVASMMAAYNVKRLKASGMFLFQRGEDKIVFRSCKACDGCGVTLIGGAIIPREYRTFDNTVDGLVFRGPIANTATCNICHGMGGLWVGKSGEKRNNIPQKRIGNRWA